MIRGEVGREIQELPQVGDDGAYPLPGRAAGAPSALAGLVEVGLSEVEEVVCDGDTGWADYVGEGGVVVGVVVGHLRDCVGEGIFAELRVRDEGQMGGALEWVG